MAYQKRERQLYIQKTGNDVCVRLHKRAGLVTVFWMSGRFVGDRERFEQGDFTQQFRRVSYDKDAQTLDYIRIKQNRLDRMGKAFRSRLRGGDEEQPVKQTEKLQTKEE